MENESIRSSQAVDQQNEAGNQQQHFRETDRQESSVTDRRYTNHVNN